MSYIPVYEIITFRWTYFLKFILITISKFLYNLWKILFYFQQNEKLIS